MLDAVQARARGIHPAREDALVGLAGRDLIHLDEGVGLRRLGGRPGEAGPGGHLQRAELHRLAHPGLEGDDAAGDLVEPCEDRRAVADLVGLRHRPGCRERGHGHPDPRQPRQAAHASGRDADPNLNHKPLHPGPCLPRPFAVARGKSRA